MASPDLTTGAGIRAALAINDAEPHGKARIVRAEALVDAADRLGDPAVQLYALHEVIDAYQFGGERFRSPVPFARILRIWDEHGSALDHAGHWSYRTHWKFKWLTSDLILIPEVPLATIRSFVADMERRYRVAGYGMRAVHAQRFHIAKHLGDDAEAEARHADWLAAERETMADCEACELSALGAWRARQGDDEGALELWSRTLSGELTCLEEPGCTLAESLLSLVRLGRLDEARSHHLRGYRLVRGHANLRGTIGEHIEFCALTGNEGRGLEILADHRTWFDGPTEPVKQLEFIVAVAMLARRLVEIGSGDLPMPGPENRDWPAHALLAQVDGEIAALTARFDARNGNDAVSRRVAERLGRRPLVKALPLGVRSALPGAARPLSVRSAGASFGPGGNDDGGDVAKLIDEARRLFEVGHPDSDEAWERCASVAGKRGIELEPRVMADLWEQRGLSASAREDWKSAVDLTRQAAAICEGLGEHGHARALDARAAFCVALADPGMLVSSTDLIDGWHAQVQALFDVGEADAADLLLTRHCQAAVAHLAVTQETEMSGADGDRRPGTVAGTEPGSGDGVGTALSAFTHVVELLASDAERHAVPHRLASAQRMRAEIALQEHRPDEAVADLLAALDFETAYRPWLSMHTLFTLARAYEQLAFRGEERDVVALGRAVETAQESLAAAAAWPEEEFLAGPVYITLANLHGAAGRDETSARYASEAASWGDRNGDPGMAAAARFGLARTSMRLGRPADAATVLESSMPQLVTHLDEESLVHARWCLGRALTELDDPRGAAEQFTLGALLAETWPSQRTHALLAADAAHALNAAGLSAESQRAFEKAIDLLRTVDSPVRLAKTLRALAWAVFGAAQRLGSTDVLEAVGEADEPDYEEEVTAALDRALLLFAEAEQVLDATSARFDAGVSADELALGFPGELAYERAETQDQLARLHIEAELPEKALPYADRAASRFRDLLPDHVFDYDIAEQMAAWLMNRFTGAEAAMVRLEEAISVCGEAGVEAPRCVSYLEQLRGIGLSGGGE